MPKYGRFIDFMLDNLDEGEINDNKELTTQVRSWEEDRNWK